MITDYGILNNIRIERTSKLGKNNRDKYTVYKYNEVKY